jgi:hypothetical protein
VGGGGAHVVGGASAGASRATAAGGPRGGARGGGFRRGDAGAAASSATGAAAIASMTSSGGGGGKSSRSTPSGSETSTATVCSLLVGGVGSLAAVGLCVAGGGCTAVTAESAGGWRDNVGAVTSASSGGPRCEVGAEALKSAPLRRFASFSFMVSLAFPGETSSPSGADVLRCLWWAGAKDEWPSVSECAGLVELGTK